MTSTARGSERPFPLRVRDPEAPRAERIATPPPGGAGATPTAPSTPGGEEPTGRHITYATVPTPLGCLLFAATSAGIRAVDFGTSAAALEAALRRRSPTATVRRDDDALGPWLDALLRHLDGRQRRLDPPLDAPGTPFEKRVWDALREIPYGATRSYGEVARSLGEPAAAREVGEACAANPVALIVPCHRVVRSDGRLGGYRWGGWRKHALLTREARATTTASGSPAPSPAAEQPPLLAARTA